MNYINKYSYKCLLGPQAKEIKEINNLFLWQVQKKKHFAIEGEMTFEHIEYLKTYAPSNFHYINNNNLEILKQYFNVDKANHKSIILNISDLSFSGKKNASIRHALNKAKKNDFVIENNFRDIQDVKNLIEEWSNDYTDKYFRDNSGKNMFFYKNNFHNNLPSIFIYHQSDLIAFGTCSQPSNGYSSYILGKALYKRFYGLSEFADVELYKLMQSLGVSQINMGAADNKNLLAYKAKFEHIVEPHYDGEITL